MSNNNNNNNLIICNAFMSLLPHVLKSFETLVHLLKNDLLLLRFRIVSLEQMKFITTKLLDFVHRPDFYKSGRWTKSRSLVVMSVTHHRQNPLECK
jgi:hypothetical protein